VMDVDHHGGGGRCGEAEVRIQNFNLHVTS